MSFSLEGIDELQGVENERAIATAVILEVPLPIALHSVDGDSRRWNPGFWDTATRSMQRRDACCHVLLPLV